MSARFPETLQTVISHLRRLPGVGTRTAERFAFELLKWKQPDLSSFGTLLSELTTKVLSCKTCGCLSEDGICRFCDLTHRDPTALCILSSPRDAYAIEETRTFRGLYHVIEHLLSPLDNRHASALRVDRIIERITQHKITEVILALDSTLEGDTTALFLKQQLSHFPLSISRLAFGLPVGSNLEYIDSGTLAKALSGRQFL